MASRRRESAVSRVAGDKLALVTALQIAFVLLMAGIARAANPAAETAKLVRELTLDSSESYRVRDLQFAIEDARFYLNEGVLVFAKPVAGRRIAAVFSAAVESGDAEMLLMPPTRGERQSLAGFTKSPNLAEHLRSALFLFTDETGDKLLEKLSSGEFSKKMPEEGLLIASEWNAVTRNLASSFETRLVEDIVNGRRGPDGFFFAAVQGVHTGNFDFIFDPRARQHISVAQLTTREGRTFYDLWTHFQARSFRDGKRPPVPAEYSVEDYKIEVEIAPSLHLKAVTKATVAPSSSLAAVPFDISSRMEVTGVEIDGVPAEVFRRESLRSTLLRGDQNDVFLVVPAKPLEKDRRYEFTFRHEGDVIADSGNRVYFVAARVNWYPQRGARFSRYDMTFRYPQDLTLVAAGERVDERTEGTVKISHYRAPQPIRFAGFNLGDYRRAKTQKGEYVVEVYGNKKLEAALDRRPLPPPMAPPTPAGMPRRRLDIPVPSMANTPTPSPMARLESMATDIATEFEWMAAKLGPPPVKTLAASPIPGNFGQGFPGLLYLSTLSYLDLPAAFAADGQSFFAELLHAHETAHQWWGNLITSTSYEDDWVQEGLANYLALLALENRRGTKAMEKVLDEYRDRLLRKDPSGNTIESAGPVTLGLRLNSAQSPGAWRAIIYDKGTWVMHMLRRRMGDDLFFELLATIVKRYQFQSFSTQQLRTLAAEMIAKQPKDGYRSIDPQLETFFENWTAGTGIPSVNLKWTVQGVAPKVRLTATITQSEVSEEFSDAVPIEIQFARGRKLVKWVRTSAEPITLTWTLPAAPTKVQLDPGLALLKR